MTSAVGDRFRDWWRFVFASTAARSRASRDILAARSELARLRQEFRRARRSLIALAVIVYGLVLLVFVADLVADIEG